MDLEKSVNGDGKEGEAGMRWTQSINTYRYKHWQTKISDAFVIRITICVLLKRINSKCTMTLSIIFHSLLIC